MCNADETQRRIAQHNKEHFNKLKSTKAHNDKACDATKENTTRDAIIKGELNRDECDDDDACQLLQLLKRPKGLIPDNKDDMQVNEWNQVVRRAKKRSTSSMFLMRDCSVCERALESDHIEEVLVKFYHFIIKHNHYPRRWLKVVDTMIENVKGPCLKKLRTLKMIEACLQLAMRMHIGSRMN